MEPRVQDEHASGLPRGLTRRPARRHCAVDTGCNDLMINDRMGDLTGTAVCDVRASLVDRGTRLFKHSQRIRTFRSRRWARHHPAANSVPLDCHAGALYPSCSLPQCPTAPTKLHQTRCAAVSSPQPMWQPSSRHHSFQPAPHRPLHRRARLAAWEERLCAPACAQPGCWMTKRPCCTSSTGSQTATRRCAPACAPSDGWTP